LHIYIYIYLLVSSCDTGSPNPEQDSGPFSKARVQAFLPPRSVELSFQLFMSDSLRELLARSWHVMQGMMRRWVCLSFGGDPVCHILLYD
jgi:hypothetical protein